MMNLSNAFSDNGSMSFEPLINACLSPVNDKIELSCLIREMCKQSQEYLIKYSWFLILLPVVVNLIIFLAWHIDARVRRKTGESIFRIKYLNDSKSLYVGWSSFDEFKYFVFRESLLFAALIGGVLLVMHGGAEWLTVMIFQ